MLAKDKLIVLKDLVKQYSREEIIWTSGYLAGILEQNQSQASQVVSAGTGPVVKPTIIYGTETGNSKKLALQLQGILKKNKIQSKVFDAFQYPVEKIEKESFLIFIISTQGEGDPPQNAVKFFDNLSNLSVNLSKIRYAVLALGDSSYPLFCRAGEVIEEQMVRLKAQRVIELRKSDVDYAPVAENWFREILEIIQVSGNATPQVKTEANTTVHKKTYEGILTHKVVLNDRGSNKKTYHVEIAPDEEINYEPGDAIGFYPENNPEEIKEIAALVHSASRYEELLTKNIRGLSRKSLEKLSQLLEVTITEEKADLVDILKKYPVKEDVSWDALADLLHPVSPRLYSVSSSPEAHDGEVHLTVTLDTFVADGVDKTGFCSHFLAEYPKDKQIEFYIHKNQNFKLPEEDKDIIMIGPGTGIAPFRSFIAHRDAIGAEGRNWLFFGEQHFVSDFYYQTEIQEWLSTGLLTRLDTAFSRDQEHKIYVQDRLREKAKEVYEWISNGAYLYVCGQKNPMSTDVENTLVEIIAGEAKISETEARAFIENLEAEGRYQKDVY